MVLESLLGTSAILCLLTSLRRVRNCRLLTGLRGSRPPFLCSPAKRGSAVAASQSWQLSFTLPPLLLLILGTDPLVRLEVGHPLPVDLDLVGVELPQAPADGLESSEDLNSSCRNWLDVLGSWSDDLGILACLALVPEYPKLGPPHRWEESPHLMHLGETQPALSAPAPSPYVASRNRRSWSWSSWRTPQSSWRAWSWPRWAFPPWTRRPWRPWRRWRPGRCRCRCSPHCPGSSSPSTSWLL